MTDQGIGNESLLRKKQSTVADRRRRFLIVEDDPDNQTVCRLILEHGGFEVIQASDCEEALQRARADLPDLIIMVISIPVIDGWEVTRILKEEEGTRGIPILVLSAHALRKDLALAAKLGCAGFLVKPIAPSMILKAVTSHLDGAGELSRR